MPAPFPSLARWAAPSALAVLLAASPLAQGGLESEPLSVLVERLHEAGQLNGTVLVAERGGVLFAGGAGLADASWGIPNGPDTRFRIGSVTKQFTAALVMQLVEEGRLALDAPVTRYLPEYPATGDRVTLHHLLGHTSGVPDYTELPEFEREIQRASVTLDALVATFSGLDLAFEPGEGFAYSNSGYVLLGAVLERVTGRSYGDLLRERLLEPLGLDETAYDDGRTVFPSMARGYVRLGSTLEPAEYADASWAYSAGGIVSTVGDLHRWAEALYRGGPFRSPATAERMRTPQGQTPMAYGLVVYDQPVGGLEVPTIVHGGFVHGYSSALAYSPEEGRTVVVLDNTGADVQPALIALTAHVYGQPVRTPKRSIADVVADAVASDGIEAAAARYREARESERSTYLFRESALNALGSDYLGRGDLASALGVLALNAEAYPESASVHDSLGEALLAAGDTTAAAASYRTALALDPDLPSARAVLESLGELSARPAVEVDGGLLESYAGAYELQPGVVLRVERDGDGLVARLPGTPPQAMEARSEAEFALPALGAQVTFGRDAGGAGQLTLRQGGVETVAPRVARDG